MVCGWNYLAPDWRVRLQRSGGIDDFDVVELHVRVEQGAHPFDEVGASAACSVAECGVLCIEFHAVRECKLLQIKRFLPEPWKKNTVAVCDFPVCLMVSVVNSDMMVGLNEV